MLDRFEYGIPLIDFHEIDRARLQRVRNRAGAPVATPPWISQPLKLHREGARAEFTFHFSLITSH